MHLPPQRAGGGRIRSVSIASAEFCISMKGFDRSLAILVAIDRYQNGIPRLNTPVADATALGHVLKRLHGFEATVVANEQATGAGLRTVLAEFTSRVGPDDRVLFYFAGHGIALPSDGGPRGFILPQDAKKDASAEATFVPMTEIDDLLSALPCRHM